MREINRFGLFTVLLLALLSLVSCTAKTNSTENNLVNTPGSFDANNIDLLTPDSVTPTVKITPSEAPPTISVPYGKIAYTDNNGVHIIDTIGQSLADIKVENIIGFGMIYDSPAWSPDGHWLAFVGTELRDINNGTYGYPDIYIVKNDGTGLKRLTSSPQYLKSNLSWSPDKRLLLLRMGISIDSAPSKYDLYLINSDNGTVSHYIKEDVGGIIGWSSDGANILFSDNENKILYSSDKNGQNIEEISKINIPSLNFVSLSTNGNFFTYVTYFQYGDNIHCGDIFVNLGNENSTIQITDTVYDESSPEWSPDGNLLIFLRENTKCDYHPAKRWWNLVVADLKGNETIIPNQLEHPYDLAWAPVPNLQAGMEYIITQSGANLNIRSEPSLQGKVLEKLPAGETITVLEGYVDADDYYWWKIQTQDGIEGWIVEMAYWYKPLNE